MFRMKLQPGSFMMLPVFENCVGSNKLLFRINCQLQLLICVTFSKILCFAIFKLDPLSQNTS